MLLGSACLNDSRRETCFMLQGKAKMSFLTPDLAVCLALGKRVRPISQVCKKLPNISRSISASQLELPAPAAAWVFLFCSQTTTFRIKSGLKWWVSTLILGATILKTGLSCAMVLVVLSAMYSGWISYEENTLVPESLELEGLRGVWKLENKSLSVTVHQCCFTTCSSVVRCSMLRWYRV